MRTSIAWKSFLIAVLVLESATGWAQNDISDGEFAQRLVVDLGKNRRSLDEYFRHETRMLTERCLAEIRSVEDWQQWQAVYRRQLAEMLGLEPPPARTELHAQVVGELSQADFTVERLQFQSMPGLYVTANLYRPLDGAEPRPAILYLCGHARVKDGETSFGNKTAYHHHGAWFARHGFVCLMIDTIQLGEIEGVHHGTHHLNQWWWNSRGYTPAGVEAWNAIRALDYLETRPEVDAARLGVTGRSGGGAYSWWVAALDPRVAAAVPVAGITSLHNHVVDGCVEGHCDCMYMVNTYRWDFPLVAALVAPRPLLISNSDRDPIFPLEGVIDVHQKVRRIYRLLGAEEQLGLNITAGSHTDTQDLQVPALRWFQRFLQKSEQPIQIAATKVFDPPQLKVFSELPRDERVTSIQESFISPVNEGPWPATWLPAEVGSSPGQRPPTWTELEEAAVAGEQKLREQTFAGWPDAESVPVLERALIWTRAATGARITMLEFESQAKVHLPIYVRHDRPLDFSDGPPTAIDLFLLDDKQWSLFRRWLLQDLDADAALTPDDQLWIESAWLNGESTDGALAIFFPPRGIGPTAWESTPNQQIHIRRRYMLLGQTWGGMQVWDIRRAIQAIEEMVPAGSAAITLHGRESLGGSALFAALGQSRIGRLKLHEPPVHHRQLSDLLNVARWVEPVQLAGLLNSQGIHLTVEASAESAPAWSAYQAGRQEIEPPGDRERGEFEWRSLSGLGASGVERGP